MAAVKVQQPHWTLPFRVWTKGQEHPYPDHLQVPFTRPEISDMITFESFLALREKLQRQGLGIGDEKPHRVSLDVPFIAHTVSYDLDIGQLNTSLDELAKRSGPNHLNGSFSPLNECILLDTSLSASIIPAEKYHDGDAARPARLTSGILAFEVPVEGCKERSITHWLPFDWVNILLIHSLYQIAKSSGEVRRYRGTYGQILLAKDLGEEDLRQVHESVIWLGLERELDHEPLDVSLKRIGKFIPSLLKWAHSNKISFSEALKMFEYKSRPECRKIFERIRATCESAGDINVGTA